MFCEFKKQNGNSDKGKPCRHPETPRIVSIPRDQPELDRRRAARREQPQEPKKKPR